MDKEIDKLTKATMKKVRAEVSKLATVIHLGCHGTKCARCRVQARCKAVQGLYDAIGVVELTGSITNA